jgi:hypothetical protein
MISLLYTTMAARRPNVDGNWIEILIPVLIIIVYAVSGILKMRSNLREQQKAEGTQPRYKPLDEDGHEWERSGGELHDRDSARLERLLENKPMPRPQQPAVRPHTTPGRVQEYTEPHGRRTLDAFLATEAPKSLSERIAEARAKAEAVVRAQEQAKRQSQAAWPHAAERTEAAQARKPKTPAPAAAAARTQRAETEPPTAPSPLFGDLTDMDSLRKAIVYSEILASPVAFRDMNV